jgi:hypothetical protein
MVDFIAGVYKPRNMTSWESPSIVELPLVENTNDTGEDSFRILFPVRGPRGGRIRAAELPKRDVISECPIKSFQQEGQIQLLIHHETHLRLCGHVPLTGDRIAVWTGHTTRGSVGRLLEKERNGDKGCRLMLYSNLLRICETESKSDIIEIMDSLSCFLHNVNSTSRIQDATWKCMFAISV